MNYRAAKISITIFCSIFIFAGICAVLYAIGSFFAYIKQAEELEALGVPIFMSAFALVPLLGGSFFIFVGTTVMRGKLKQLNNFEKMTYEWYKNENPNCVGNNYVSCSSCGGKRINVRALMNKSFHREHFCTQCGKTLYYSEEQN